MIPGRKQPAFTNGEVAEPEPGIEPKAASVKVCRNQSGFSFFNDHRTPGSMFAKTNCQIGNPDSSEEVIG